MEVHGALGLVSRNILIRGLPTELKETGISVAVAFESAIRYKRDKTGLRRADSVLNKRYHGK